MRNGTVLLVNLKTTSTKKNFSSLVFGMQFSKTSFEELCCEEHSGKVASPLHSESEFRLVFGKNRQTEFFQELDQFTPRFIDTFWAKGEDIGSRLTKILQQIENKKSNINAVRTDVLHGLPLLQGEDPSDFYKIHFDCDDNEDISHTEKGIVIPKGSATIPYSLHLDATTTAFILEGTVVVDEHENIPHAICLLFGLIYALNLSCNTEEHIRLHIERDFVHWPKF